MLAAPPIPAEEATDKLRPTITSPTVLRAKAPITFVDKFPPIFTLPNVDRRPCCRVELLIFMAKPCVFVTARVLIDVDPLSERLAIVVLPRTSKSHAMATLDKAFIFPCTCIELKNAACPTVDTLPAKTGPWIEAPPMPTPRAPVERLLIAAALATVRESPAAMLPSVDMTPLTVRFPVVLIELTTFKVDLRAAAP
jgi:hypothetical protein